MTRLILMSTDQSKDDNDLYTTTPQIDRYTDEDGDMDVFISTQIQSRIDDIDEEDDNQQRAISFLSKFKNTTIAKSTTTAIDKVKKSIKKNKSDTKKKKTEIKNTGEQKTKPKGKKLAKDSTPKSITEAMLMKFSGKPQKIIRFIKDQSTKKFDISNQKNGGKQLDKDWEMTTEEWTKTRYILHFKPQESLIDFTQNPSQSERESLWHSSKHQPEDFSSLFWDMTSNMSLINSEVRHRDPILITKPFTSQQNLNRKLIKDDDFELQEQEYEKDNDYKFLTLSQIIGVRTASTDINNIVTSIDQREGKERDISMEYYTKLPQYCQEPNNKSISTFIDSSQEDFLQNDHGISIKYDDETISCSEEEFEPLDFITGKERRKMINNSNLRLKNPIFNHIINFDELDCSEEEYGCCYNG